MKLCKSILDRSFPQQKSYLVQVWTISKQVYTQRFLQEKMRDKQFSLPRDFLLSLYLTPYLLIKQSMKMIKLCKSILNESFLLQERYLVQVWIISKQDFCGGDKQQQVDRIWRFLIKLISGLILIPIRSFPPQERYLIQVWIINKQDFYGRDDE